MGMFLAWGAPERSLPHCCRHLKQKNAEKNADEAEHDAYHDEHARPGKKKE
jgi:hypothetical protein